MAGVCIPFGIGVLSFPCQTVSSGNRAFSLYSSTLLLFSFLLFSSLLCGITLTEMGVSVTETGVFDTETLFAYTPNRPPVSDIFPAVCSCAVWILSTVTGLWCGRISG